MYIKKIVHSVSCYIVVGFSAALGDGEPAADDYRPERKEKVLVLAYRYV